MTANTCSTLAQIVPVLMLAVLLEGRTIGVKYRSHPAYLPIMAAALVMGFFSLIVLVIGVNGGGLGFGFAFVGWAFPATLLAAAVGHFMLIGLTVESEGKSHRADLQARDILRATWCGRMKLRFTQEGRRLRSLP
ncbi:hypothetical protein [Curtobacterium sp. Leaf154]|uniref:hypothetical protein n=1 Tax=Curtobacterium sp. Leaf154 TaxID=1736277 RepID=UPI0012E7A3BE|nr:hypothetical protein [Curtobacterium sp. Leaf154]